MSLFEVQPNGLITVDSTNIKESFETAYKEALGANLNTEAGTPQGQMIITDTKMLSYAQNQCALIANAYSVLTAVGKALDVAAAFWGYYRKSGQQTVVNATITGSANTIIPAGALVSNGSNQFQLLDTITIPVGGTINAQFQAIDKGAISCEAGTLTEIISTQTGWDTITNSTGGIVGYAEETDNQFRARITANWLNIRAKGELGAIMDNLAQLDGVLSVLVKENPTNVSTTIDGITLVSHSIYISIVGGNSSEIAKVIYYNKASGSATNGDTTCTYRDDNGINNSYLIKRAESYPFNVKIRYSRNTYATADIEEKLSNLLNQYIIDNPFKIGQIVSGADLASAFADFGDATIVSIKFYFTDSPSTELDYINATIAQIPQLEDETYIDIEEE